MTKIELTAGKVKDAMSAAGASSSDLWKVPVDEIHVIDFHAASGQPISHYAGIVNGKPYRYATHWLPHDAKAKTLASGGKSVIEPAEAGRSILSSAIRSSSATRSSRSASSMPIRTSFTSPPTERPTSSRSGFTT